MGGSAGDMLAASRRDPNFRGIDPDALGQLVRQATDASNAIRSWLGNHPPPPGVSSAGYAQAAESGQWLGTQLGMLTRRRNYALTHPDPGGGIAVPPGVGKLGKTGSGRPGGGATTGVGEPTPKPTLTPHGAGPHLGGYPTHQAAVKAAAADALTIKKAEQEHTPIPGHVWEHLQANVHDPDYTQALYDRLGPAATAGLIAAAGQDKKRLHDLGLSIGIADHQHALDEKWLRALLTESGLLHERAAALQVLSAAHLTPRTSAVLEQILGGGHATRAMLSPGHGTTTVASGPHLVSHRLTGDPASPRLIPGSTGG